MHVFSLNFQAIKSFTIHVLSFEKCSLIKEIFGNLMARLIENYLNYFLKGQFKCKFSRSHVLVRLRINERKISKIYNSGKFSIWIIFISKYIGSKMSKTYLIRFVNELIDFRLLVIKN